MRLNPFSPYLPRYPGPHHVGTIELELPLPKELHRTFDTCTVRTLLVRIFYPTTQKHGTRPKWVGHGTYSVQGYAKFLGLSESVLRAASYLGLKWTEIPATSNSPLAAPSEASSSRKWPCMVFSHGLGGTRNAYSQVCGSIASGGIVVMALEHRDNSAAISVVNTAGSNGTHGEEGKEEVVEYVSIKDSTPANIAKRRAQMAQRAYETRLGLELFRAIETGDRSTSSIFDVAGVRVLETFRNSLASTQGDFLMAGHSFGAATGVHCCKDSSSTRLPSDPPSYSLCKEFKALILLDVWMEVLVDSTNVALTVPTLCIASQAFQNWSGNWSSVLHLMRNNDPANEPRNTGSNSEPRNNEAGNGPRNKLCWIKESAHLSQSDFQLLFPTATKYAFKAGIDPHIAMTLNVRAVREFLRSSVGVGEEAPDPSIFRDEDQLVVVDL